MVTFHLAGPIRENMLQSCQWLLCGQVKKQQGKAEVQRLRHGQLQPQDIDMWTRFDCFPFWGASVSSPEGSTCQGHVFAEPERVPRCRGGTRRPRRSHEDEADLAVTHPKHAHLQSNSSSTQ